MTGNALIIGASRGIGLAVFNALAAKGWQVTECIEAASLPRRPGGTNWIGRTKTPYWR